MTLNDWLTIMAILIAPIAAVQVQKFLELGREKRAGKLRVFKTLMATRANPVSREHVEALNMIDIEFYGQKKITDDWKLLLDNFNNYPKNQEDPAYPAQLTASVGRSEDLIVELLSEMGKLLNYNFDKVHIKRGIYIPKAHGDIESEQEAIRKNLISVFSGDQPISVKIIQ